MAKDATPLIDALLAIIEASRVSAGGGRQGRAYHEVLEAVDNPKIIAALAAHGRPVTG